MRTEEVSLRSRPARRPSTRGSCGRCARTAGRWKIPRYTRARISGPLPRLPNGKLDRVALIAASLNLGSAWDAETEISPRGASEPSGR